MGKRKLRIQRLECARARQERYSKRKIGVLKKAKDLATLCDVDLMLLMFSPTGKPSLQVGQDKDLSTILERLSALSLGLREERREYTMKSLKKRYQNEDNSEAIISAFSPTDRCDEMPKVQYDQLLELKEQLTVKRKILRDWMEPQLVNDLGQLQLMEDYLSATLSRIKSKKYKGLHVKHNGRKQEISHWLLLDRTTIGAAVQSLVQIFKCRSNMENKAFQVARDFQT